MKRKGVKKKEYLIMFMFVSKRGLVNKIIGSVIDIHPILKH